MASHATGIPPELLTGAVRLIRPRDATGVYTTTNPSAQLARLADRGLLRRVAPGYYVVVPADRVGDPGWRPPLVATAWAVAAADYGVDRVAVCGPSAARSHGLIPRELATAFVAVPKQRPRLELAGGEATYITRDIGRLDLERWNAELGEGWITTIEQTVLDLATRPNRWQLAERDLGDAIRAARPRLDADALARLADAQDRTSVLRRIDELGGDARR